MPQECSLCAVQAALRTACRQRYHCCLSGHVTCSEGMHGLRLPMCCAGRVTHRLLLTYKLKVEDGGKFTPTLPALNRCAPSLA